MNNSGRLFLFGKYILPNTIGTEIGVWWGSFSDLIIEQVELNELHLIDTWTHEGRNHPNDGGGFSRYERTPDRLREKHADILNKHLFIHKGYSQDLANTFSDGYFDWVYVDGDHSYEGASSDILLYTPKLKNDGFMIVDDYAPHVIAPWGQNVVRAVDHAVETGIVKLVEIRNEQAILKKP